MKEDILREMIRKQIKSSLNEAPIARSAVSTKLSSVEKMAGVKMLKKALGQGGPQQQAAGLLAVVKAISGNNSATGKMLARMLMKSGIAAPEPAPVEEGLLDFLKKKEKEAPKNKEGGNEPIGVDYDGNYIYESANFAVTERGMSAGLTSRMGRVDKTQAMVAMKKALSTKPATQQVDFVIAMVNDLGLKDSAKKRLLLKLRKGLS